MKVLSLTEPWATLLVNGYKKVETRSWTTHYRGWMAIQAAQGFPGAARRLCRIEPFTSALASSGRWANRGGHNFLLGYIIGLVYLNNVWAITEDNAPANPEFLFGDYTPGRYGWDMKYPLVLPGPIPAKGLQRIWNWTPGPKVQAVLKREIFARYKMSIDTF